MNALPGAWNGPPIIGVSPFVETFLVDRGERPCATVASGSRAI
jgi:hypothetical protein